MHFSLVSLDPLDSRDRWSVCMDGAVLLLRQQRMKLLSTAGKARLRFLPKSISTNQQKLNFCCFLQ